MSRSESMTLESLVAAHLDGETPQVPEPLQAEFATAIAAYDALTGFILATETCAASDPDERRPPDLADEYEIAREIGRGGMGVVYLVLVAQAVYSEIIAECPNLVASVASRFEEDYEQLEFAAKRYGLFLDGPYGSEQERELAAGKLREMHRFLDARN